ncbi:hypothetical protein ACLECX_00965 [Lonsdalea quercina]|uniref:hypothetical protein n=1 Tax=Lonsdalea quercina TaxID=71657 RepID=UPI00397567F6
MPDLLWHFLRLSLAVGPWAAASILSALLPAIADIGTNLATGAITDWFFSYNKRLIQNEWRNFSRRRNEESINERRKTRRAVG